MENGRIAAVAEGKELSAQIDAEIIDLEGKFVIPGLIDCHIHMDMSDITLQHGSGENPTIGIYKLSSMIPEKGVKNKNQMNKCLGEVADYVDLTTGNEWRD